MAKYPNIKLTQKGLDMAINADKSKKLIYTHIGLGDGRLAENEDVLTLTAMKSRKIYADIADINNDTQNQVTLETIVSNKVVNEGFYAREIGIYAKLGETGQEVLYAYANAGDNCDYMPDKTQPIDELKLRITLIVGNVDNVTAIVNSSIIFITLADCRREIQRHNVDPLAHNNLARKDDYYTKAQTDAKLNGKANTSHGNHVPNLESANNARFLRNDNTWQQVTPNNIGAYHKSETYNKGEVNNEIENISKIKVQDSRNSETGRETEGKVEFYRSYNNQGAPYAFGNVISIGGNGGSQMFFGWTADNSTGPVYYRSRRDVANDWSGGWRKLAFSSELDSYVKKSGDTMTGALNVPTINTGSGYIGDYKRDVGDAISGNGGANVNIGSWWGVGFYDKCNSRYTGTMDLRNGNWRTVGNMTADEGFIVKGNSGFVFGDHNGGWYMKDNDWIRSRANKSIYTAGSMKADGGFEGTSTSSHYPVGFNASSYGNQGWGNQNGITKTSWYTSNGGGIDFRENGGQLNVKIDGVFYQDEGTYRVLDVRGGTVTGSLTANGGFVGNLNGKATTAGTADNAKNFDGRSLSNILGLIDAANTGIIAAKFEENGWVKFKNGFIVQWGKGGNGAGSGRVNFPITFPKICVYANAGGIFGNGLPDNPYQCICITKAITKEGFTYQFDNIGGRVQFIAIGY